MCNLLLERPVAANVWALMTLLVLALFYSTATQAEFRDPTKPYTWAADPVMVEAEDRALEIRLNGVMIRGDLRKATLNGQRYAIGDELGPLTVTQIEAGRVRLSRGPKHYDLRLNGAPLVVSEQTGLSLIETDTAAPTRGIVRRTITGEGS